MSRLLDIESLQIVCGKNAEIVRGITMHIGRREIVGIAGPSGSGKSMTMWAVPGLVPDGCKMSGTIRFYPGEGNEVHTFETPAAARVLAGRQVAIIPQNPFTSLNPVFTCGTQILECVRLAKRHQQEPRALILHLLETLGFEQPQRIFDAYPFELSGGQLQRVVIAMAFASDPALIIADEPTTALDVQTQSQVMHWLTAWTRDNARSLVFVSHDLLLLYKYCDRIVCIRKGSVVQSGTPEEIRNGMRSHEALSSITPFVPPQLDASQVLCDIRNISVSYRSRSGAKVQALNHVQLQIMQHEVVGIVGATGCGKSTLAKVLAGLVEVHAGEVWFDGKRLDYDRYPHLRAKVQLLFQDPYSALYPHWTVGAYLREAIIHHHIVSSAKASEAISAVLEHTGLPQDYAQRFPYQLSGGERQRVQIARALLIRPALLICDEITSGLDAAIQGQILQLLIGIQRETGMSLLMITHDLRVVRLMASRVVVMEQGEIVESGTVDKVFSQPEHAATISLLQALSGEMLHS